MKVAKKTLIERKCQEAEACIRKIKKEKVYQLVKDLTAEKLTILQQNK